MQNSRSQSAKSHHAALHDKITAAMAWLQVPGAVVGLFRGDEEHAAGFGVTSLRAEGKEPEVADPWAVPRCRAPAGGLLSTVRDMLRYARFHLGDGTTPHGTRLLAPATLARMQSPHAAAGSVADAVGLSWLLDEAGSVRIVWHGGATNGQTCTLTMLPERRFAMVILTNANCGAALYQEVARWARACYLGIEPPEPAPLRLSPAELETYAGSYDAPLDRVDVSVEGERLKLTFTPKRGFPRADSPPPPAPPPVPAAFFERDRIMGVGGRGAGNRGEFLRDAEGRIVWLRWHGRIHARQE